MDSIVSVILLIILGIIIYPSDILMPKSVETILFVGFTVVFLVFAGLVWKEQIKDERDESHRALAGRIAFIAGCATLAAGIVMQSTTHNVDPWLVGTLAVMVLTKTVTRIYSSFKH